MRVSLFRYIDISKFRHIIYMFQKIVKTAIYLLVFLLPLFWLPFSLEAYEFNKGYLLFFLVSVAILGWLGHMIFTEKRIRFRRTPLDYFVLGFLALVILSAVLSKDRISSILGFYGRFWPSLLGTLSLGGFYFLLTNNVVASQKDSSVGAGVKIRGLFKTFFLSTLILVLVTYLSLFGIWARLGKLLHLTLPPLMTLNSFNTVGSLQTLALFLAIVEVLLVTVLAFKTKEEAIEKEEKAEKAKGNGKKRKKTAWLYFLLITILGILAVVNFWQAWLCLFISLLVFLVLSFWKRVFKEDVNRLSLPIFVVLISLIFLFPNPATNLLQQSTTVNSLPRELLLSQGVSWTVGANGLRENPFSGSGLGTFHYLFSKFKPTKFLQSPFWQIRFDRSSAHIVELLGTTGILGILSYLAMIGIFFIISYFYISTYKLKKGGGLTQGKSSSQEEKATEASVLQQMQERKLLVIPLLTTFVALFISQFLYYQTTVLGFLFWLVLGLGVVSWGRISKERVYSFKDFPEVGLVLSVVFWVIAIGACFCYFNLGKYYLADANYRDYLNNPNENFTSLEKAARMGNQRAIYHIVLARAYLQKFIEEAIKSKPDAQVLTNTVALAVDQARQSVVKGENWVAAQETAGVVYREIQGAAQGALEWGLKSFEKALTLEPKNSVLLTELGKLRVVNNEKDKAKSLFEKATQLRGDYADAALQMALLEEAEGKVKEAQARLESLVQQAPFSVEAHFQLGRLYYNDKEYDKASQSFQQALALFPNHSNSLYSLGLIYEREGKKEKALETFRKVLELNPGNKDIQDKINTLQAPPKAEEPKEKIEEKGGKK